MPNRHRPAMPRGSLDTPRSVEARWKRQNETQFIVYSVYVHVYVDVYLSICLSVYLSVYRSNIHVHITVISHDKYMHIRRMIVFIYVYNIYIYIYICICIISSYNVYMPQRLSHIMHLLNVRLGCPWCPTNTDLYKWFRWLVKSVLLQNPMLVSLSVHEIPKLGISVPLRGSNTLT